MSGSLDSYVAAWRLRAQQARKRDREALREARERLPALCQLLRERGARRVWLIGSLTTGTFRADSDIDLVAEGLPHDGFFQVVAELEDKAGRRVDLIPYEAAAPSLKRVAESEGQPL
jgi:predicted nucleotidyltransferase